LLNQAKIYAIGLIALISLLTALATVTIVRKRR